MRRGGLTQSPKHSHLCSVHGPLQADWIHVDPDGGLACRACRGPDAASMDLPGSKEPDVSMDQAIVDPNFWCPEGVNGVIGGETLTLPANLALEIGFEDGGVTVSGTPVSMDELTRLIDVTQVMDH